MFRGKKEWSGQNTTKEEGKEVMGSGERYSRLERTKQRQPGEDYQRLKDGERT